MVNNTILVLGGDGYLGWSLALALANRTDQKVVIVDNLAKRSWEDQVHVSSLVQLKDPEERVRAYRNLFGRANLKYEHLDLTCYEGVRSLVKRYHPNTIINAAQQPSAPFSMMNPENARVTMDTNITTNLNAMWAIGSINPDIRYITLGSAGSYLSVDSDLIPTSKVDLSFLKQGKSHRVLNSWLPMQASDIYHQSKANAFLLNDTCSNLWGLKTITVQQSTIFGHTIAENENEEYHELSTRLNYDHIFGTVVNRFACQLAIRFPMTVYGDGTQKTGIISLSDTVDHFIKLCELPVERGQHIVKHNYTHTLSINEIAQSLAALSGLEVQYLKNPRYEPKSSRSKVFESSFDVSMEHQNQLRFHQELKKLFNFVSLYKENINPDYIRPNVSWKLHQEADVTEISNRVEQVEICEDRMETECKVAEALVG